MGHWTSARRALRNIVIGLGGENERNYPWDPILPHCGEFENNGNSLDRAGPEDLRENDRKNHRGRRSRGNLVTTEDLEVGAMIADMRESINPDLLQTIEGQPVLVHAGRSPTSPSGSHPSSPTGSG